MWCQEHIQNPSPCFVKRPYFISGNSRLHLIVMAMTEMDSEQRVIHRFTPTRVGTTLPRPAAL